jgi:pyrroloquinoline quinone (PQQ) biosynthesis protein C
MNTYISQLQSKTASLSEAIVHHPAYNAINSVQEVRVFMEHHIYAVWDFMSLLKALQRELTCTSIPWMPVGDGNLRYLINEIVTGEESDRSYESKGTHKSHFELYLEAMEQCGASTFGINELFELLQTGITIEEAVQLASIPEAAKQFLNFTFEVIATGKPHVIGAVFTFGREDLIPNMFHTIVNDINNRLPNQVEIFKYYLDRHIEVDGDHHSHLALQMVETLCGNDDAKWSEAHVYVERALKSRIALWDGVLATIQTAELTPIH